MGKDNNKKFKEDKQERRNNGSSCDKSKDQGKRSYSGDHRSHMPRQDWQWNAKDAMAAKNMASIPFNEVLGDSVNLYGKDTNASDAFPGFVVIHMWPGVSNNEILRPTDEDSLTKSATAYFQEVTQGYSSSVDFEAPDLLFTVIGGAELAAFMCHGKRAFGMLNYYLQFNSYLARRAVEALGFDFDSLSASKADFCAKFNTLVAQFNKTVAVPKQFNYANRAMFVTSYVFSDTEVNDYSLLYMPVRDAYGYYSFNETGTCIKYMESPIDAESGDFGTSFRNRKMTVTDYFATLEYMLNSLTGDDQRNMFGAVRRVYQPSDLLTATELTQDFVTPVYVHPEFRAQVNNLTTIASTIVGLRYDADGEIVSNELQTMLYQLPGGRVRSNLCAVYSSAGPAGFTQAYKHLINVLDYGTTPEQILEVTTMKSFVVYEESKKQIVNVAADRSVDTYPIICRTDVVTGLTIHYNEVERAEGKVEAVTKSIKTLYGSLNGEAFSSLPQIFKATQFNRFPIIYIGTSNAFETGVITNVIGEVDKYTLVSSDFIEKVHRLSYFTLFALPENSKSITK